MKSASSLSLGNVATLPTALESHAAETDVLRRNVLIARLSRDLCRACHTATGPGSALGECARLIARAFELSSVEIWMLSESRDSLELKAAAASRQETWDTELRESILVSEDSFPGSVLRECGPILFDALGDPNDEFQDKPQSMSDIYLGIPMFHGERPIGALLVRPRVRVDNRLLSEFESVASEIADAYPRLIELCDLWRRDQLHHRLVHRIPVALVGIDCEQHVTSWNPAAQHLFGWTEDDVVGRPINLVPQDDRTRFNILLKNAFSGKAAIPLELLGQRWDGRQFPMSVGSSPVFDDRGTVEQVVLIIADQTRESADERRQECLFQVASALAGTVSGDFPTEDVLRTICTCHDWSCGEAWRLDEVENVWKRLGVWHHASTPADAFEIATHRTPLGVDAGIPGLVRLNRTPQWVPNLAESNSTPRAAAAAQSGLHDGLGIPIILDGDVTTVLVFFGFEIPEPDEGLTRFLASVAGQIEQFFAKVQAEQALWKVEEDYRQSQKMESIGRLAGGIAHDFNNILTIVLGHSEIVLQLLDDDSELQPLIEDIQQAGERAAALTRQLLAFSRKQVLTPTVLDLNERVRDMENMLRRLVGDNIHLESALSDALHKVKVDPAQIEQVLLNLAVNARDAMPDGGRIVVKTENVTLLPQRAKSIRNARPGEFVSLSFSDSGCGIDAQSLARIFEPFFTTKAPGKGTGMGLSTVYGIVEQSEGFIDVQSAPGAGTTFVVYLPKCGDSLLTLQIDAEPPSLPTGTETILVVEDDDHIRALTARLLQARGYSVIQAACGTDAIAMLNRKDDSIDMLLTDVMMPGMSGPQLAGKAATMQQAPRILFMSGYVESDILQQEVLDPGYHLLQKPFTSARLAEAVRRVLDGEPSCPH